MISTGRRRFLMILTLGLAAGGIAMLMRADQHLAEPAVAAGLITSGAAQLVIAAAIGISSVRMKTPFGAERDTTAIPAQPDGAGAASFAATPLSRRQLLKAGSLSAAALASGALLGKAKAAETHLHDPIRRNALAHRGAHNHFGNVTVGDIDTSLFDPSVYLEDFDYGKVSTLPDGRTLREFEVTAVDVEIEVAPGVYFPAWTYNGKVPGPTLRATEGDLVRVHFRNAGSHPHTIHFHGFHKAEMDGVFELVRRGESFTYEFEAGPFGLHLYHCHTLPLKRHIHKGLYGVFIVDPRGGRPPMREMVMMLNAFDTNFDGGNEVYAVNTVAFHYLHHPIRFKAGEMVRLYVVNITEFDLINSFHSHATFFHEYRTGTKLEPDNFTDTIILGQGERSILELKYDHPGNYMFHAHVSEFAELGWSGMFEVTR